MDMQIYCDKLQKNNIAFSSKPLKLGSCAFLKSLSVVYGALYCTLIFFNDE